MTVNLAEQDQKYTDVGGEIPGDCWRTAIACLLELPLGEVPHFLHLYGKDEKDFYLWWKETVKFVEEKLPGWTLLPIRGMEFPVYTSLDNCPSKVIINGKSPRGDWYHCVLADSVTGEMVWDPHPSRDGITTREEILVLTEKDK